MSKLYPCHCYKKNNCNCIEIDEDGLINSNKCYKKEDGLHYCNKKQTCECDNPPILMCNDIEKINKEIEKKIEKKIIKNDLNK